MLLAPFLEPRKLNARVLKVTQMPASLMNGTRQMEETV